MNILAVIPARGGSKGIPRKNLAPLGGRPLLAHTVEAARASRLVTRVLVSTDDDEIANVARRLGADVPFLRSAALAGDHVPMLDVLIDVVRTLEAREQYRPDVLVLLQPTSPFRPAARIDEAVDLLLRSGAESVVSVVAVPHQFTPSSLMRLDGDRLTPWSSAPAATRRQDKPSLFARNGPAVLAVRPDVLTGQRTLYGSDVRPLIMSKGESIDIDDGADLELAELLLAARVSPGSLT